MVDLKPCPFCGSPSEFFDGWARVRCPECGALGSAHRTRDEAIAAWNNRTPLTDHAASAAGNDGVGEVGEAEPVLPVDVRVAHITFRKGVKLSTFVSAAHRWYDRAALSPTLPAPSDRVTGEDGKGEAS